MLHSTISIAKDFSETPGPRTRAEGNYSAEEFVEKILEPAFLAARREGKALEIDLDGGFGYATSFLEESFGGLARKYGIEAVLSTLRFKSEDEPYQIPDIERYIKEANTGAKTRR